MMEHISHSCAAVARGRVVTMSLRYGGSGLTHDAVCRRVAAGLVESGRARLSVDGEQVEMAAPCTLVCAPFSTLAFSEATPDFCATIAVADWSSATPDYLRRIEAALMSVVAVASVPRPTLSAAGHVLQAIHNLSSAGQGGGLSGYALLHALLQILCHGRESATVVQGHYRRFMGLLWAHTPCERDVSEYARMLGITPRRLGDVCREVAGRSPKDIVSEWTVTAIKRALLTDHRTVSDLAADYGFSCASNMVRLFTRVVGMSPALYRKTYASD